MNVARVYFDGGSRIEPPLNQSWSNLEKLRWHAAVVELEAGIRVNITPSTHQVKRFGVWRDVQPQEYDYTAPGVSGMLGTYCEAWAWLNGLAAGARFQRG